MRAHTHAHTASRIGVSASGLGDLWGRAGDGGVGFRAPVSCGCAAFRDSFGGTGVWSGL